MDNLPLGEFTHRCMTPQGARLCIEQARRDGRLICVSQDDLNVPYRKRELENHQALCKALQEYFDVALSVKDFFSKNEAINDSFYTTTPLIYAQAGNGNRLLVVDCSYRLRKKESNSPPAFDIEPMSIEFHVIEPNPWSLTANNKPAFRFHPLSDRLSA